MNSVCKQNCNTLSFFLLPTGTGMPFYQAVNILRRQDRTIKGVQVWYSDQVSHCLQIFFFHLCLFSPFFIHMVNYMYPCIVCLSTQLPSLRYTSMLLGCKAINKTNHPAVCLSGRLPSSHLSVLCGEKKMMLNILHIFSLKFLHTCYD